MNDFSNLLEEHGLLAWGFPYDGRLKFDYPEKEEPNPNYFACQSCHGHFPPNEMGVIGSPDKKCHVFVEMIELCPVCMDKEIIRLAHITGIPDEMKEDVKWIAENALLYAKTNQRFEDVSNMQKLLFLLNAKKHESPLS
jgi:hypothetical protein